MAGEELNRRNGFWALSGDNEESPRAEVCGIDSDRTWIRPAAIEFHVSRVRKPLGSAVKMVEHGNRVVLDPDASHVQNTATEERLEVRLKAGTCVEARVGRRAVHHIGLWMCGRRAERARRSRGL